MAERVVVVTGVSAGVGRAVACQFGATGATLALMARGAAGLAGAAADVEAAGGRALVLPAAFAGLAAVTAAVVATVRGVDR